jgi:predicted enzyme related to lactoylglutathione lyase
MIKRMWNFAVKVEDLQRATDFYSTCFGGEVRIKGEVLGSKYVLLRLGEMRVILMDKAPYEEQLNRNLPPGFLHLVFEVDDFDAHLKLLRESAVKIFMEPCIIEGEFGKRKIVFFETPEGIRTEIMQTLEDTGKA